MELRSISIAYPQFHILNSFLKYLVVFCLYVRHTICKTNLLTQKKRKQNIRIRSEKLREGIGCSVCCKVVSEDRAKKRRLGLKSIPSKLLKIE